MFADIRVRLGKDRDPNLDTYINYIDLQLHELLDPIRELDASLIPSGAQREKFMLMREMIGWANSFAGTLRYDVQTTHDDCPEHDEHARRSVARAKAAILGEPLTEAVVNLVNYNYSDEKWDIEVSEREGNETEGHIFHSINKLAEWLSARKQRPSMDR